MWKKGKDYQADKSKYIFPTLTGIDQCIYSDASPLHGKQYFSHMPWTSTTDYEELMKEEKGTILEEFKEYKENKETGH